MPVQSAPVDLTTCDREPIHIPGSIQPFGFLLVVSQDLQVVGASQNVADFLGAPFEDIARKPLPSLLSEAAAGRILERVELLHGPDAVERLFAVDVKGDGMPFDVAVHMSGLNIIVECEPSARDDKLNSGDLVRTMLDRIRAARSFDSFIRESARQMKLLTGFDRVMIYRFEPDGAGEVVAEAARRDLESYLGLHYPASDIPKQARILYARNWLRIIADIDAPPSPLVSAYHGRRDPVDLSMSVLRSVSPIHIEYLRNMGVGASMSVSIMRDGKLWGLFACHHYSPHHLSFEKRTAAELFGQMFSWILETREREVDVAYEAKAREIQEHMVATASGELDPHDAIARLIDDFRRIVDCDGIGVWNDGEAILRGETMSRDEFVALVRFLNRVSPGRVFAIDDLGSVHKDAREYVDRVAGVLAVPISRAPRDYLMFFRQEAARSVTWAGDPNKPVVTGPLGDRLTPRKSFEIWREVVRGRSKPWRDSDLRIAESLRVTLLEVILRLTDIAQKERKNAQERQELLIAELNHRVRNILSLIRGLINQSRSTSTSVEEFASIIGGRVQALARAHDQLTAANWGPGRLQVLLESEAGAYLGDRVGRVRLEGPDVALDPKAFSTLALVMHEMMTNSAKYGALCDSTGAVDVTWRLDEADRLIIEWHESGGPPVAPPNRRGFGTTIIERSIPFDLNGEAEIQYDLLGVKARFVIPPAYLHVAGEGAGGGRDALRELPQDVRLSGTALIVEDNLIIAVNAEGLLLELGAQHVDTAGSVAEALRTIERSAPDFALLDLNLGPETSLPVGRKLAELGVPFIFATGYGDRAVMPPELAHAPIIQKPYTAEGVKAALNKLGLQPKTA
jgi:light-regulated signal transduction histidine kinase (bacteriophytochrome)/CheY-like chemotaxis protein